MGTADPDFPNPTTEANELAAAMNANVVLIDGAGHYPQAQAPAAVADAIEALASQVN
jgi:pimeloyl-ACP methyl ester carboxylesterase